MCVSSISDTSIETQRWGFGVAPIAIVMISLNEGHNMESVMENLHGWAQEVFLVDSFSQDNTVDIALQYGAHVVQREFMGFGDQWNFALEALPIKSQWIMKLDPDERITDSLKAEIVKAISNGHADAFSLQRRLWFMGKPLPIRQRLVRIWRTGACKFSSVPVNEHPMVEGKVDSLHGYLEHHDSPNLHHWYDKQNQYSTLEALAAFRKSDLTEKPKIFGNSMQRRMWIKKNLSRIPFVFTAIFLYNYFYLGAWKAGRIGYIWSVLRVSVYRARLYKLCEMQISGQEITIISDKKGAPDKRVTQY